MFSAPHSQLLCDIVRNAEHTPDKLALVEGAASVTYAQLVANIESAAASLQALGLKQGDHIILAAQKEVQFVYL